MGVTGVEVLERSEGRFPLCSSEQEEQCIGTLQYRVWNVFKGRLSAHLIVRLGIWGVLESRLKPKRMYNDEKDSNTSPHYDIGFCAFEI